jgi:hypothetical protein
LNFLYDIECPIKKGNEAEKEETGDFVEADLSEVNVGFVVEFTISFSGKTQTFPERNFPICDKLRGGNELQNSTTHCV